MVYLVADALFDTVRSVHYRRGRESQDRGATATVDRIITNYEIGTMSSLILTGDRGYWRDYFADYLAEKGIRFILIMPRHLRRIHSFDPSKLPVRGRSDSIDEFNVAFSVGSNIYGRGRDADRYACD